MKCIYLRTNTVNGKQYVGQANDFGKREREWRCLSGHYAGKLINRARDKYGIENFKSDILKECQTQEELNYWEQYYIKELNTKTPNGYNLTDGGDTSSGYKFTEEAKKKLSDLKKGYIPWIKGKHHTEEVKKKLSEMKKGKPSSKRKKIYQYTIDGELVKVWESACECGKYEFTKSCVLECCMGVRKTHKGYRWSYTKKEDIN